MSKEVETFRFLKDRLDELRETTGPESVEDKILAIFSFAMVVGGCLSEYNLLTMLVYAGVDLNDHDEKEVVGEIVAFYAGTGIIEFKDNSLGLLEAAVEKHSLAFEIGQGCDVEETRAAIEMIKENMFGAMDSHDLDSFESDENEVAERKSFGTSFCPKCNMSIQLTDTNKFVIHFSAGISNPYAEVTCEKCGAHYQIGTTWKNAYKFDAIGCQALPFSFARGAILSEEDISGFMEHFDEEVAEFLDIVWKEFLERN